MAKTPPFTLLLPVYHGDNAEHFLRSYTSATTDQTLPPDEVVIVQDGPVGPELAQVLDTIRADPAVHLVRLDHNSGLAHALDAGLAACTHEIVARTDADDVCVPDRFARQLDVLTAGNYDIVGSAIREFEAEGDDGVVRVPPLEPAEIADRARFHSPFNHPTVVYRKSVVAAAGGYQDLPYLEDYWLFTRMLAAGAQGANIAEPLLCYRVGAGAYARRGGVRLFRSEIELQRNMRQIGFISAGQCVRNVVMRGGYRLIPESVRRRLYRAFIVRGRRTGG